jgi:hypothetical protein
VLILENKFIANAVPNFNFQIKLTAFLRKTLNFNKRFFMEPRRRVCTMWTASPHLVQKIVGSNPRHGGRCQARCCLWLKYYALFMIIWGEIRKKLKEVVSSICSALTPLKVQTDVWQYNWSCLEPDAIEQTACRQGFKIAHGWIWKVLATKKGLKFRCFFSFLGCPQPQCSDTFPASDGGFLSCQCLLNSNSVV